jgi:hypothetical protein
MKTKIKEIQDYFAQKIYDCDFEIVNHDTITTTIIIDDLFTFELWKNRVGVYEGSSNTFMIIDMEEDKSEKYIRFINTYGVPTKEEVKAEKLEQYNKLKKELNL